MITTRKQYVDYIKAIGIILVILGHINFANDAVKEWIYAFHMPVFFFATGLVLKKENPCRSYLLKKFQGLVIPYLIWAFLYAGFSFENAARIGYGSYYTISSAGSLTSLWFLPTMFIAVVICQLILKLSEKKLIIGIFAAGTFVISIFLPRIEKGYPWCVDVSLLAVAFILFGYLFEKIVNKITMGGIMIFLMGTALTFTHRMNPIVADSYVLMARMRIGNPVVFLITALGGCLMAYGAGKILESLGTRYKVLTFIGKNTLVIFAVQKPIISVFEKCFYVIGFPWVVELVITGIGTLICSCVLCSIVNKFAPCLAGRGNN